MEQSKPKDESSPETPPKATGLTPEEKRRRLQAIKEKEQEIARIEARLREKQELPHLHAYKFYQWSREFFESTNKENFLCAANQISKSSTQIRKCIEWATNPKLWPKLWPGQKPNQFWYFYPNFDTATAEFNTKWKQFLPKGSMKDDPARGYTIEMERKQIKAIHFNSGITVYFKAYSQKIEDIQAGTVFSIFLDEECPVEFLPEIQLRVAATDGYLHMVFTATLGQDYWRRTIQPEGTDEELHVDAWKRQVSMYDCQYYEDGTPSRWTMERIKRVEQKCGTKAEIDRRVNGKFVVSGGLKFESFDREKNTVISHMLPKTWHIYVGVDYGSGGERGHPAAIVFVGVRPDYKAGRVFKAWRGDKINTASPDILDKLAELRGPLKPMVQVYDHSAKDLFTIACSRGETLSPAEKGQNAGTDTLNALFKNEMLKIQRGDPELEKLCVELTSLLKSTPKTQAADDLCDALRYACMAIPWDWTAVEEYLKTQSEGESLKEIPVQVETEREREMRERRGHYPEEALDSVEQEILAWNELYEC